MEKAIRNKAGLKGYGFKISYRNREFVLTFTSSSNARTAAVVKANSVVKYRYVSEAIAKANDGYVKLLADCDENLMITKDLHIEGSPEFPGDPSTPPRCFEWHADLMG